MTRPKKKLFGPSSLAATIATGMVLTAALAIEVSASCNGSDNINSTSALPYVPGQSFCQFPGQSLYTDYDQDLRLVYYCCYTNQYPAGVTHNSMGTFGWCCTFSGGGGGGGSSPGHP